MFDNFKETLLTTSAVFNSLLTISTFSDKLDLQTYNFNTVSRNEISAMICDTKRQL